MKNVSDKEQQAVLKLVGPARFKHFVKQVADWGKVWCLDDAGWALAGTEQDQKVMPLWSAAKYAEICAEKEWRGYKPVAIPLERFMQETLPQTKKDGIMLGVFYTPGDKGVIISADELGLALQEELQKY
jgi:hypothetical protein